MEITLYKRGKYGKKIHEETKTRSIKVRFKNRRLDLEKCIYIGRNKTNTICIHDDALVSRKHAIIEHIKGKYYLSDLDSTNGTYINNFPVQKDQRIELISGDVIRVGKTELTVV